MRTTSRSPALQFARRRLIQLRGRSIRQLRMVLAAFPTILADRWLFIVFGGYLLQDLPRSMLVARRTYAIVFDECHANQTARQS